MKLKQRLISNTFFNILGEIVGRAIGLVMAPYVLYKLGLEQFAIWSIMGALLGYLTKADMGVATSYVKFISQYYAQKDYDRLNKVISCGFIYYVVLGGVLLSIAYLWGDRLFSLFQIQESMRSTVNSFFHYAVLISVCSAALGVFGSVLWGIQRVDIIKKIRMASLIVEAVCKVIFLELGYQLGGLVWTAGIIAGVSALAHILFSYQLVPQLRFNPFFFDKTIFRKMFKYGAQLQLSRFANIGQMHLSKLILAASLPLSHVAIYDLGNRGALSVRAFPLTLLPSILPAASELHALKDQSTLRQLYRRASKYMSIVVMYFLGFFLCMMPVVVLSWLGDQVDAYQVSLVGRILLVGYSYSLLVGVISVIVLGMGHPEYSMRSSVIILVANVSLNLLLIPVLGFPGAALATAAADVLGALYLAILCHRKIQESYLDIIVKCYLWPIWAGIIGFLSTFFLYKMVCYLWLVPQGRLQNIAMLTISGIVFTILYGLIIWKSQYLDEYDRTIIFEYCQKGLDKLGIKRRMLSKVS